MYKPIPNITLLILCFCLTACSTTSHKIWINDTAELMVQRNYKKALEQATASGENKTLLISKIKKESDRSSKKSIKEIKAYIAKKQWGDANKRLNHIIQMHPWTDEYAQLKIKIDTARNNEIRLLETESTLVQANLLQVKLKQLDFDIRDKTVSLSLPLTKFLLNNEKKEVAKKLYELSITALGKYDYLNAQKTYSTALDLDNSLQKASLSKTIHNGINQKAKNTILKKQRILIKQLNQALESEDHTKIIMLHGILSNAPFKGKDVKIILDKASKARKKYATTTDNKADSVYRNGDIEQAITLWKKAKILAPSLPNINDKLTRAEKVQTKLDYLRQNNRN